MEKKLKEYCGFGVLWDLMSLEYFLTHFTTFERRKEEQMKREVFFQGSCNWWLCFFVFVFFFFF